MGAHKISFSAQVQTFVLVDGKDATENRIVLMVQMS